MGDSTNGKRDLIQESMDNMRKKQEIRNKRILEMRQEREEMEQRSKDLRNKFDQNRGKENE